MRQVLKHFMGTYLDTWLDSWAMDEDSEASLHKVVGSEWIESKVDAGENVQHANKQELKT